MDKNQKKKIFVSIEDYAKSIIKLMTKMVEAKNDNLSLEDCEVIAKEIVNRMFIFGVNGKNIPDKEGFEFIRMNLIDYLTGTEVDDDGVISRDEMFGEMEVIVRKLKEILSKVF